MNSKDVITPETREIFWGKINKEFSNAIAPAKEKLAIAKDTARRDYQKAINIAQKAYNKEVEPLIRNLKKIVAKHKNFLSREYM